MVELIIGLSIISIFWLIIQMIFISQNVNNFFGTFMISLLHIMTYIGFLFTFTAIDFDILMFSYAILIFIVHALIHIICLSLDKNSSYLLWSIGFMFINIIIIISWYYLFFLEIL